MQQRSRGGDVPAFSKPESFARSKALIAREQQSGAHNYEPLPVVLSRGEGSWITDVEGRRLLDLMSAYSAVSFGHAHPRIVGALVEQAQKLAVTSRAYYNDRLPQLMERLARITGLDRVLPASGGAEAVETAIKAARKWGHKVKGIADGRAAIIACDGNFHGRTITITGLVDRAAVSRRLRSVSARTVHGAVRRCGRARARDHAGNGGVPRRADPGRGRHRRAAGWLSRGVCGDLQAPQRAADRRRSADRSRAHRLSARLRARRREAGRRHPRQGARRRPAAGVRVRRERERHAGVQSRRPRQHVRRQSARGNGRDGGARRAVRRAPDRACARQRRTADRGTAQDRQPADPRRARARAAGRYRDRRAARGREDRRAEDARARHAVEGHARHGRAHRAAAEHRGQRARLGDRRDRRRCCAKCRRIPRPLIRFRRNATPLRRRAEPGLQPT